MLPVRVVCYVLCDCFVIVSVFILLRRLCGLMWFVNSVVV